MKKLKMSSHSKTSGQVIVILIIVLGLVGAGFWYLLSNKQEMAREGKQFARDATQRIVVQRDINFFNSHLSPQARMNFPASAQQDFMNEIASMGAPASAIDVKGEIEFNSQFFEPHGSFQARINYTARYADFSLVISHPVGRWQIDDASYLKQRER
jgi:hypothetical protein